MPPDAMQYKLESIWNPTSTNLLQIKREITLNISMRKESDNTKSQKFKKTYYLFFLFVEIYIKYFGEKLHDI